MFHVSCKVLPQVARCVGECRSAGLAAVRPPSLRHSLLDTPGRCPKLPGPGGWMQNFGVPNAKISVRTPEIYGSERLFKPCSIHAWAQPCSSAQQAAPLPLPPFALLSSTISHAGSGVPCPCRPAVTASLVGIRPHFAAAAAAATAAAQFSLHVCHQHTHQPTSLPQNHRTYNRGVLLRASGARA